MHDQELGMAKKKTRNPKFLGRGEACLSGYGAGFGALLRIFIGFGARKGFNIPAPPRNIYVHANISIYNYTYSITLVFIEQKYNSLIFNTSKIENCDLRTLFRVIIF